MLFTQADDDASKAVIRAVCLVVDAFHFTLPAGDEAEAVAAVAAAVAAEPPEPGPDGEAEGAAPAAGAAAAAQGQAPAAAMEEADEEEEGEADAAMADAGAAAGAPPAAEVYRLLARRVVPELQRIMVNKHAVRAPVALAGAARCGCRAWPRVRCAAEPAAAR